MATKTLKLNREVLSQSSGWNSLRRGASDEVIIIELSLWSLEFSIEHSLFTPPPPDTRETVCGTCQGGGCVGGTAWNTCATCYSNCDTCYHSCPVTACCTY